MHNTARRRDKLDQYIQGFTNAGFSTVEGQLVTDSGHYAPEENPQEVWNHIAAFMRRHQ